MKVSCPEPHWETVILRPGIAGALCDVAGCGNLLTACELNILKKRTGDTWLRGVRDDR
jgi:hypothetical protein